MREVLAGVVEQWEPIDAGMANAIAGDIARPNKATMVAIRTVKKNDLRTSGNFTEKTFRNATVYTRSAKKLVS